MLEAEQEISGQRLDRLHPICIGVFLVQVIGVGAVTTRRDWVAGSIPILMT
ncbi:MAG: hypothetical protein OXI16_09040 [Chloroflexota bacterium]|nr:hypothetical protein [Chloroflexota bacterium]